MSDMVERLTVVLGEQLAAAFTSGRPVVLSKVVRAMLENMREPTPEMKNAGAMNLPDYDPSDNDAEICWQNMLDEALK